MTMQELHLEPPWLISSHGLVSCVISECITCKTWPTLPRKAEAIVEKLTSLYMEEFEAVSDNFWLKEFRSYNELVDWCREKLLAIDEIRELNLSQEEFERGVGVDDEERGKFVFTDRYSPPCKKKDDFMDLDAFYRNVAHSLILKQIIINFRSFPGSRHYAGPELSERRERED